MKKERIFRCPATALVLMALLLSGCAHIGGDTADAVVRVENNAAEELFDNGFMTSTGKLPIEDNSSLYENWDYDEVTTMYLTVRSGNKADGTDHTWKELNTHSAYYYEDLGIDRYKVEGLLQVGDENGPLEGELGYGQYVPNAVVQIRGQSSTLNAQKNYRISIYDGKGDWEGQTTINLNKHAADATRFMNMLCYKLMAQTDGMMSARTRFVHLYVKDETASGDGSGTFADYGLYTYVEQINKTYLKNHNLDRNGQLYKVNYFEFYPYKDVIMLKSDADYDLKEFEKYMEIKGNDDHTKLIQMLEDLNNYGKPIEEVFEKWFDEENYFTWLAFHILVGNKDTDARNHFLYSPNNINKFYFISWDNDGAMRDSYVTNFTNWNDGMAYEEGVSKYWGNVLHRRVLQSAEYKQKLDDKINELKQLLTKERLTEEINHLSAIVEPYLYSMPDIVYARVDKEEYSKLIKCLPEEVENNYQKYLLSLEKPMPFFIGIPRTDKGKLKLSWETAYDFDQETIEYTVELCRDYYFENCIYKQEGIMIPEAELDMLPEGQYFLRVTAKNSSGYEQYAFDYYMGENGKQYGVMCFWITREGKIEVNVYEE